jgi:hypothetical protein
VSCARCRGRREAPLGEACGSRRRGELRGRVGLALAAAIRELVITTGPLVGKLLLRERGDSPLFHRWLSVVVTTGVQMALFVGSV